jgi:antitoxin HicB
MKYGLKIVVDNPGWLVTSRDIPQLTTGAPRGTTKEFAAKMGLEALHVIFELLMEQGKPIPLPSDPLEDETIVELNLNTRTKIWIWNEIVAQKLKPAQVAKKIAPFKYPMTHLKDLSKPISLDAIAVLVRALGKRIAYDFI